MDGWMAVCDLYKNIIRLRMKEAKEMRLINHVIVRNTDLN